MTKIRVGLAGATGYSGQEVLRLVTRHPHVQVTVAMASSTSGGTRSLPALAGLWNGRIEAFSIDELSERADVVFLGLPDTASAEIGPELVKRGARVFDLSGAFRLRDAAKRKHWYPKTPALGTPAVYGLTEWSRDELKDAQLVACPGCYPTAALLALRPLIAAGLIAIDDDVYIDAKSGISGAGKTPSERTHFSECHGSISAYGIFAHRHAAEIEQELSRPVTFVPHLVPLDRGIFETIYARVSSRTTATTIRKVLEQVYRKAPFVRLTGNNLPEIKHVAHTNFCDIGWKVADGRLVMVVCLDNLMKGAAGQAVQNFNVALDFDECEGLL